MRKSSGKFALVVAVVAIASLAVTALALPALSNAKAKAQSTKCRNNLKQLAIGIQIGLKSDHYPAAEEWSTWLDRLSTSSKTPMISQCPAADLRIENVDFRSDSPVHSLHHASYALNERLAGKAKAEVHPDTVMLFEAEAGVSALGGPERLLAHSRHAGKINIVFADGSVHEISLSQLDSLRWNP